MNNTKHQLSKRLLAGCARRPWVKLRRGACLAHYHCRALALWRPRLHTRHTSQLSTQLADRLGSSCHLSLCMCVRVGVAQGRQGMKTGEQAQGHQPHEHLTAACVEAHNTIIPPLHAVTPQSLNTPKPFILPQGPLPLLQPTTRPAAQRAGTAQTARAAQQQRAQQQHHSPACWFFCQTEGRTHGARRQVVTVSASESLRPR